MPRHHYWPGQDVHRAYKLGYIPENKFKNVTLSDGLRLMKRYFPSTVTYFTLNEHDFRYGYEAVQSILATMPEQITRLIINGYGLRAFDAAQMKTLFTPYQSRISELNWYYDDYDDRFEDYQFTHDKTNKPCDELLDWLKMLTEIGFTITQLHIKHTFTFEEWMRIANNLPKSITRVNMPEVTFTPEQQNHFIDAMINASSPTRSIFTHVFGKDPKPYPAPATAPLSTLATLSIIGKRNVAEITPGDTKEDISILQKKFGKS